jgi:glycosyltransferase involved in cell wall biosynthesis
LIYAICAFSRPQFVKNVIRNFRRQTCKDKKLIVVENGGALGECARVGFEPDVLLRSEPHQSYAKNEALKWIRRHGGGWFSTFDDDDYYGPHYLQEVVDSRGTSDIVAKHDHFYRGIDDRLRLFESGCHNQAHQEGHGATISARADDCPDFQNTGIIGEDHRWISDYQEKGAKLWLTSPYHYMVVRHANNTWQIRDDSYERRLHFASRGECRIWDYGAFRPAHYSVVNGATSASRERVHPGEMQETDSPMMEYILANSPPLGEIARSLLTSNAD